jgi:hypothetical protein
MPVQITGRMVWSFEPIAEGQGFKFEMAADNYVQAAQKLRDALLKIATDLEAEIAKNN